MQKMIVAFLAAGLAGLGLTGCATVDRFAEAYMERERQRIAADAASANAAVVPEPPQCQLLRWHRCETHLVLGTLIGEWSLDGVSYRTFAHEVPLEEVPCVRHVVCR